MRQLTCRVCGASLEGVTGRYFWQRREEQPNPQAEDADARRRLVELARAASGL